MGRDTFTLRQLFAAVTLAGACCGLLAAVGPWWSLATMAVSGSIASPAIGLWAVATRRRDWQMVGALLFAFAASAVTLWVMARIYEQTEGFNL